jgi:GT2 family glycosyltransferase
MLEPTQPMEPKVAIVIVTYNAFKFVKLCLDSVEHYSTVSREIIVVDNCSDAHLRNYLKQHDGIKLILNKENKLWCEGCNQGIQAASPNCNYILLLNSDMEIRRADWLQRMINVLESSKRIGIVGTAGGGARVWPTFGGVDGQCMMIKKKLIDKIGLLDSKRFPWAYAPIDLVARAFKKGYIYKIMPKHPELVVHYQGMSRRDPKVAPPPAVNQDFSNFYDDMCGILKDAGLPAVKLPRFVWEIYKRLPNRPFFKLTDNERRIAKGKKPVKK